MARICIVTPGQVGSNPRVVKEADSLAAAGFDVHVVATKILDLVEPRDQDILANARYPIERVAFNDRFVWLQERLRQAACRKLFSAAAIPAFAVPAYSPISRRLGRAAAAQSADLYIAHYVAALPVAAQAARKYGAAYAFDAEDFHLEDQPDSRRPMLEKRLIREIESRYLPGAAFVTAASPMIADAYADTYGIRRPTVVLNVFPRANAPSGPTERGTATPGPSLYWFSQTIGPDRGLETAIEAIARAASAPHLYLRGTPASGYADTLRELARQHGVSDRLHLLAPEVPTELERLGAQYDLGYTGETGVSTSNAIALTNKLFSYLVGGVPSLASDIPAYRAIAPELGEAMRLFPLGDAMALATELDRFLLNPERLAAARAHAWQLGQQRYCWEVEQRTLLGVVESVIACPAVACEVA